MAQKRLVKGSDGIVDSDPIEAFLQQQAEEEAAAASEATSARRPKNEGYLAEVRPGVWRLKVYRGRDPLGSKRYKTRTVYGSRSEASRALMELQLEYGSNSPINPSEMTLGLILTLWRAAHRDVWQPATRANHRSIVNRLEPLADIKVDQTKPKIIATFYDGLLRDGLAPSTVTRIHSAARSAVNWAIEQGHVRTNPIQAVRSPGTNKTKPKMPSAAQVAKLVQAAHVSDPLFATLIEFAAVTGARRGEIAGLRWNDVVERPDKDFTVTFQRRVSNGQVVDGLKAGDQKRIVVPRDLVDRLSAASQNTEWVFGTANGFVSVGTISRKYKRLREGLGLDVGTFHGLRHFCGSNLFTETDMTPIEIAAHLGHSRPSITLDLYAHVVDPDQTGAAQALARAIAA